MSMRLIFSFWIGLALAAAGADDLRRDATVRAVELVMPSVVNIGTETVVYSRNPFESLFREFYGPFHRRQPNTQYSVGSGVIMDPAGYVLTSEHVVAHASRISVKLADGREFDCDRVAGSASSDVALLKIRAKGGERFAAVKFAADDDLLLGETVVALGNPFGLGGSVSRGILSSKTRRPPQENEPLNVEDWLQTDAAINPGNSGGPLVNLRGELMGINVAMHSEGRGIGFAIPVKRVSEALASSFTPENLRGLWFGASIRAVSGALTVGPVQAGSPAAQAGLRTNDQVITLNGRPAGSFIEFVRELIQAGDRQDCTLGLRRGRESVTATVRLRPEKSFFNEQLIQERLGATLQEVTPELAERLSLSSPAALIVAGVDRDSPAAKAGLERGFIITGLDGQPAADLVSAARILHAKKAGQPVVFDLIVQRRRGAYVEYRQGQLEIPLR